MSFCSAIVEPGWRASFYIRAPEYKDATEFHLGRLSWIDPADIAPTVVFLASDEARMISGAAIDVTAGDSVNITA